MTARLLNLIREDNTPNRGAKRRLLERPALPDQQSPSEHSLEDLAIAVALDAPARKDQVVTGGLEVQVHAIAVGS
jgi:hypothetical protein